MVDLNNAQQQNSVLRPPVRTGSNKNFILIVVLIGLVLIIGVVMWTFRNILFSQPTQKNIVTTQQKVTTTIPTTVVAEVTGKIEENYQSQRFQYSIKFPDGWFNIPNNDATDDYKAFSNEDVTSANKLSATGIWAAIHLDKGTEFYKTVFNSNVGLVSASSVATVNKVSDMTINGQKAVKYIYETVSKEPGKYGYVVSYLIQKENSFYVIEFVTLDKTIADKNASIFEQMVGSFKTL